MPQLRTLFALSAALLSACGIPIRVERVTDAAAPVRGVRYTLHRPSYEVFVVTTKTGYALLLEQSLSEIAWTYEATTEAGVFAGTEVGFTMENDGKLAAFSAGETDQIGPILQAAAQAAVKAAAVAATNCGDLRTRLSDYDTQQQRRHVHLRRLETLLEEELGDLHTQPKPHAPRLVTIARLREAVATSKAELASARLALKPEEFKIVIDGTEVHSKPSPCITVNLRSEP